MARKDERRKTGVGSGKSSDKPGAARRAGVAKGAVPKAGTKSAAKAAAPPPPPTPKVKFRGRLLEQEPLARYTTYRLGGAARHLLMPPHGGEVGQGGEVAHQRHPPRRALRPGAEPLRQGRGGPRPAL